MRAGQCAEPGAKANRPGESVGAVDAQNWLRPLTCPRLLLLLDLDYFAAAVVPA